jgi:hypothetical protein
MTRHASFTVQSVADACRLRLVRQSVTENRTITTSIETMLEKRLRDRDRILLLKYYLGYRTNVARLNLKLVHTTVCSYLPLARVTASEL